MIIEFNPVMLITLFLVIIFFAFFIYRRKNNCCTFFFLCLFVLYIVLLVYTTIFPITILDDEQLDILHSTFGEYITYYQFIPFKTILNVGSYNFFKQVVCNILMFVPFPIFIKLIKREMIWWKTILVGILSSLLIELIQLLTDIITRYPTHVCDIDDLILNSIGVLAGYGIIMILNKISFTNRIINSIVYKKQQ